MGALRCNEKDASRLLLLDQLFSDQLRGEESTPDLANVLVVHISEHQAQADVDLLDTSEFLPSLLNERLI